MSARNLSSTLPLSAARDTPHSAAPRASTARVSRHHMASARIFGSRCGGPRLAHSRLPHRRPRGDRRSSGAYTCTRTHIHTQSRRRVSFASDDEVGRLRKRPHSARRRVTACHPGTAPSWTTAASPSTTPIGPGRAHEKNYMGINRRFCASVTYLSSMMMSSHGAFIYPHTKQTFSHHNLY